MRTALIYNFAQHYRTNIFMLMDQQMDIDFYFGDKYLNVKKMDYSLLSHHVEELRNLHLGPMTWQQGAVKTLFRGYDTFIMLGEPKILTTWVVLLLGRLMGKKVFFWTHGWYGKESRLKTFVKKLYFGMATGTLLYGNRARQLMIEEGMDASKLTVIHNSLMYDEQLKVRETLVPTSIYREHFGNALPVIIFVGRLTAVKSLDLILRAQKLCQEQGTPFNTIIVGDGDERKQLEQLTCDLGLQQNVWFYGPSYDERELSGLIYNADLCVAPGNIGLTAMHAMTFGCPCLTHNDFKWQMPEFEAIREGKTGCFFHRGDVASLAESICTWLQAHQDDREVIRQECMREIDENWNPHVQLKLIMSAISDKSEK